MKRALPALIVLLVLAGIVVLVVKTHRTREGKPEEEKHEAKEESRMTHDEAGRVVVKLDSETQARIGLRVAQPSPAQRSPETKGYGRVLDPAPLASLMTELASAEAAALASSNELSRLKTLVQQQNTSERAVQSAQVAALRDQLTVQLAKDRVALAWGNKIARLMNSPAFVESLTTRKTVLVRIDLPAGAAMTNAFEGAVLFTLSGPSTEAQFLEITSSIDPQTQSRGALFMVNPNELNLASGEALSANVRFAGVPVTGVIVPTEAVVRTEGRGWVYVRNPAGDSFTRVEIALVDPAPGGWFIKEGVSTNAPIVLTGAQTLLSEELKSALKSD
jgi:hypothetical protein